MGSEDPGALLVPPRSRRGSALFSPTTVASELQKKLTLEEAASSSGRLAASEVIGYVQPLFFCDDRHALGGTVTDKAAAGNRQLGIVSKWRQKERLKTTAVAMVLCLNIGVDPPDVIKVSPCAHIECGIDPLSMPPQKALDAIGKALQQQYERWQPKAKYKIALDPTVDDVKRLCVSCRRNARNERVLFHYTGHGVPKPTANGEIWVFNKSFTQYIPLSVYDLQMWVQVPAIYVLDCSAAGQIVQAYQAFAHQRYLETQGIAPPGDAATMSMSMRDSILLAACQADETLPQAPTLPADLFTSCLTVPIKVALQWLLTRGLLKDDPNLTPEIVDQIPGTQTDRKTPLGELNWVFTAITDTIAWNVLPRPLFQKLFRQDLLVASLFRNFLLAERVLRAHGCKPISYPALPPTHHHHMWDAWDLAAESCLSQVPALLADPSKAFQQSTFFTDQLTAFEIWLSRGGQENHPPEQLPVVLQVLLSQQHRLKALVLLGRFIDKGPWAVELALSVGIFPYVLKLLQTDSVDLHEILVFIWAKILALDTGCQADLVKDNGHLYFIRYLDSPEPGTNADARAMAAFALAVICENHPKGQALAAGSNLLQVCISRFGEGWQAAALGSPLLLKWICLCMGTLWDGMRELSAIAITQGAVGMLLGMLQASAPEVRACAVFALGTLIRTGHQEGSGHGGAGPAAPSSTTGMTEAERMEHERQIISEILSHGCLHDASALVRSEVSDALVRICHGHHDLCLAARDAFLQSHAAAIQRRRSPSPSPNALSVEGGSHHRQTQSATTAHEAGGSHHRQSAGLASQTETSREPWLRRRPSQLMGVTGAGDEASVDVPGRDALEAFYVRLLDAVVLLATDPASRVSDSALLALSSLGLCIEQPMGRAPSASDLSTTTSGPTPRQAHPGALPGRDRSAASTAVYGGSSASPAWAVGVSPGAGVSGAGIPVSSAGVQATRSWRLFGSSVESPSSPTPGMRFGGQSPGSRSSTPGMPGTTRVVASGIAGWGGLSGRVKLPPSAVYSLESDHFRRPLLHPQVTADVFFLGPEGVVCHDERWCKVPDPVRQHSRQGAWRDRADQCRSRAAFSKLSPQVAFLDMAAETCVGAAFLPFSDTLVLAGAWGTLAALSGRGRGPLLNAFDIFTGLPVSLSAHATAHSHSPHSHAHLPGLTHGLSDFGLGSRGSPAAPAGQGPLGISDLFVVNQFEDALVLAGGADGAVRVWRHVSEPGKQQLAAAWKSVMLPPGTRPEAPVCHAWSPALGSVFSAGGHVPGVVYCWDVTSEMCSAQIWVQRQDAAAAGSADGAVTSMGVSSSTEALLACGTSDGCVSLYDIRAPSLVPAISVQIDPARAPVVSVALEPASFTGRLIAASGSADLRIFDLRVATQGEEAPAGPSHAMVCEVAAHSRHPMVAMAAHPNAPLVATASSGRVVKMFDLEGQQIGALQGPGRSRGMGTLLGALGGQGKARARALSRGLLEFNPLELELALGCPGDAGGFLITMQAD